MKVKGEEVEVFILKRSWVVKKIAELTRERKEIEREKGSGNLTLQQLAILEGTNKTKSNLIKEMVANEIDPD